jgi:uncharacterized protein
VVERTAKRIREHVTNHGLRRCTVILHGGEPALNGAEYIRRFAEIMRRELEPVSRVSFMMQSNATLLSEEILAVCSELNIRVGISLDGPRAVHDQHRVDHAGRPSHAATVEGIERLTAPRYRHLFGGLLTVISLDADPVQVYEYLLGFDPVGIDLLLPHGNWDAPPPGKRPPFTDTPYADWLIKVFERWYPQARPRPEIRLFASIMSLLVGGHSFVESVGLDPVSLLVIEADGSVEAIDSIKATYHGGPELGLNVFTNSFDEALVHPSIVARLIGPDALSNTCNSCGIHNVCGGGLYTHRFSSGGGFKNPSIYCYDLAKLISHIAERISTDLRLMRQRGLLDRAHDCR